VIAPIIKYCPSTLAEGFETYSKAALRKLFNGKKVSHVLEFDPPEISEEAAEKLRQNARHVSISGAQQKYSLLLEKNTLRLTNEGEGGEYILKPVSFRPPFGRPEELPANEHLTMQIAKQAYKMNIAECALIFFKSGESAYITKRFDTDGKNKIAQEDFASILAKDKNTAGENFRFTGSYEEIARAMKKHVAAYQVEIEKFFSLVVFNFLFSNGDAHLKNFTLQQTKDGDYLLSPVYDVSNTSIHVSSDIDAFFALLDGLFPGCYETKSYQNFGYPCYDDFYEFGLRIGMNESRLKKNLERFRIKNDLVQILIARSFLSEQIKAIYFKHYSERLKMLNSSVGSHFKS
jgi:serine/threonine-protein kinase HipA